jgi:hypothetical protein
MSPLSAQQKERVRFRRSPARRRHAEKKEDVDGRDKPGHDERGIVCTAVVMAGHRPSHPRLVPARALALIVMRHGLVADIG